MLCCHPLLLSHTVMKGNGEALIERGGAQFWDDLFLLKVNMPFLERCILLTTEEQLIALAPTLNKVFAAALVAMRDENKIRRVHSLEVRELTAFGTTDASTRVASQFSHACDTRAAARTYRVGVHTETCADAGSDVQGFIP